MVGAVQTEGSSDARIPTEARQVILGLASAWGDVVDCRELEVSQITGAMTNMVYQVKWPTAESFRKVLLRIYGKSLEVFFHRDDEIRTFECMSRLGRGPRLLDRFTNGRVEEFLHARTLSAADVRDPEISALVASKLREFHDLDMQGPNNVVIWDRLRKWLIAVKRLCSSEESKEFCLDFMEKEIDDLENELPVQDERIRFCHNDLHYGNIMMNEETRVVTIIDYEYANYNPIAFDLATYFNAMAFDYNSEKPHILDVHKYPDYEERKRFVQIYLSSTGEKLDAVEVEDLLHSIEKYGLVCNLFWGLWGIISGHLSDINFDYMEHARQRFQHYWERKLVILQC